MSIRTPTHPRLKSSQTIRDLGTDANLKGVLGDVGEHARNMGRRGLATGGAVVPVVVVVTVPVIKVQIHVATGWLVEESVGW